MEHGPGAKKLEGAFRLSACRWKGVQLRICTDVSRGAGVGQGACHCAHPASARICAGHPPLNRDCATPFESETQDQVKGHRFSLFLKRPLKRP